MKQSAVEWLKEQIEKNALIKPYRELGFSMLLEQAKEMEKEQQGYSEEDLKESYFSAISSTGEGWNGEYAKGNDPNIEEKFTEGFNEWFEKFKNK